MAHCDSPEDTLDPFTVVLCSNALDVYVAQLKPRANKVFSAAYAAIVVCPLPRSHPPPAAAVGGAPWAVGTLCASTADHVHVCVAHLRRKRRGGWLPVAGTAATRAGCPIVCSRRQISAETRRMLCSSLSRCQSSSTDAKQSSGLTAASLSSSLIAR